MQIAKHVMSTHLKASILRILLYWKFNQQPSFVAYIGTCFGLKYSGEEYAIMFKILCYKYYNI